MKIVGHFKHSVLAAEKLSQMQQLMNTPQLKLKQEVATRCNSTYIMLQRFIDIKAAIIGVMYSLQKAPQKLDTYDNSFVWGKICQLVIKMIASATIK